MTGQLSLLKSSTC